ncbi:MAG: hypothetical protein ABJH05_12175 [Fulvivirga sp.]
MKKTLLIVFAMLLACGAYAQFPSEVWHDGELVLVNGDTLKGQIKYNLETDLVQFSDDKKTIKTYTARKLLHFEIFDKTSNRYRRFYVLPYNLSGNYNAPIIFELVLEGRKLTLLSREAVEYQVANYPYAVAGSYTRLILVYTHYFLTDEGEIIKFVGKKKDLLRGVMSRKSSEIKKFIKTNRIRVDSRPDLIKTVAYYNSLFEE